MGKENNEIKRAYDELQKTKNKCGKYRKTLFHIHTPVSHDYRLFKVWNDLSEKEWNKLSVEDYLLEVKNNKLFPEEYFKTKDGDSIIYNNYQKNLIIWKSIKFLFFFHNLSTHFNFEIPLGFQQICLSNQNSPVDCFQCIHTYITYLANTPYSFLLRPIHRQK